MSWFYLCIILKIFVPDLPATEGQGDGGAGQRDELQAADVQQGGQGDRTDDDAADDGAAAADDDDDDDDDGDGAGGQLDPHQAAADAGGEEWLHRVRGQQSGGGEETRDTSHVARLGDVSTVQKYRVRAWERLQLADSLVTLPRPTVWVR